MSKETNELPGKYELEQLTIVSSDDQRLDLSQVLKEINIFEDLFSNTIIAEIVIVDSLNIPMYLPILGEEDIFIKFKTFGSNKSTFLKLKVNNIKKRNFLKENFQVFIIEAVSPEFLKDKQVRLSKSYKDIEVSEIVKDIFSTVGNTKHISLNKTKLNTSFIVSNWRAFESIKSLTNKSIGFNDEANYVFYQTTSNTSFNSEYHFKSINNLMKTISSLSPLVLKNISTISDTMQTKNRVRYFEVKKNINQVENLVQGMYGSTLQVYDTFSKTFTEKKITYSDHFSKFSHTEKNPLGTGVFSKDVSTYFFNSTSQKQFQNDSRIDSDIKEWLQIRRSQLQQLNNFKITVQISGNNDMKVGDIAFFNVPSTEIVSRTNEKSKNLFDRHYSGKFLVTAIRHILDKDTHNMIVEITKDSLKEPALLKV